MAGQMQYFYGPLPEQSQEDALHAARLLSVEERPFQRLTKNLLGKTSPLKWVPKQLPSPPPDGADDTGDTNDDAAQRQKVSEDILLDFVALESSAIRIQLIQNSNERERERYAAEKAKILETAQAVRDNTILLRSQLAEAQRILDLRKGYDNLAKKLIPDDNKLKPRDACTDEIEKLEKEIEDLQHESDGYEATWLSRREAFERVVSEGQSMIKLIKGIKDEPDPDAEKDERMEGGDGDGDGDEDGAKGERSHVGTPMPGGATPLPEIPGGETPRPDAGDETSDAPTKPINRFLDVGDVTRSTSRAASPAITTDGLQADIEMEGAEAEQETDTEPHLTVGQESFAAGIATPEISEEMDET